MIKGTKEMAQQLRALVALPKDLHLSSYPHWAGSTSASNSSSRFPHLSHSYGYSHVCAHTHTKTQTHTIKRKVHNKGFSKFPKYWLPGAPPQRCVNLGREDVRDCVHTWSRGQAEAHALLRWDCFLYFAFLLLLVFSKNVLNVL